MASSTPLPSSASFSLYNKDQNSSDYCALFGETEADSERFGTPEMFSYKFHEIKQALTREIFKWSC